LKAILILFLACSAPNISWSWPKDIPYPEFQGDILPYYKLVNGNWIQVRVNEGCSSTPVTIVRKRFREETWNNRMRGGSSWSEFTTDSGQQTNSTFNSYSAKKSAESWNMRSSQAYQDWHDNRLTGRIVNDDFDSMTFYPCGQVHQ
jgi:hypothetical protein